VFPDIGSQSVCDRGTFGDGLLGNPTQRVDAADTDRDVSVSQLLHGAGEPVGELALPGQP